MPRVFVIEDQIDPAGLTAAFDADHARRGEDGPRLELVGLAQNESDAYDQLEALDLAGSFPDAIVLDDYLPHRQTTASRLVPIMRWLLRRAQRHDLPIDQRPRMVLWSSCESNLVYTYCALGGLQYQFKKDLRGQDPPVEAVWRALAGQRWRPAPYPSERDLTSEMRAALPYLEHGWTQKKTALHLGLGERGLSGFVAKVKDLERTPAPMSPDYPTNDAGAIRLLKEAGWVWVPYRLYSQMPAGMPLPLVIDPAAHREDLPPLRRVPDAYLRRVS